MQANLVGFIVVSGIAVGTVETTVNVQQVPVVLVVDTETLHDQLREGHRLPGCFKHMLPAGKGLRVALSGIKPMPVDLVGFDIRDVVLDENVFGDLVRHGVQVGAIGYQIRDQGLEGLRIGSVGQGDFLSIVHDVFLERWSGRSLSQGASVPSVSFWVSGGGLLQIEEVGHDEGLSQAQRRATSEK
nr:hypothetical protein [Pseudomonas sp. GL-B-26]